MLARITAETMTMVQINSGASPVRKKSVMAERAED
jgi:hypothetical protein